MIRNIKLYTAVLISLSIPLTGYLYYRSIMNATKKELDKEITKEQLLSL